MNAPKSWRKNGDGGSTGAEFIPGEFNREDSNF